MIPKKRKKFDREQRKMRFGMQNLSESNEGLRIPLSASFAGAVEPGSGPEAGPALLRSVSFFYSSFSYLSSFLLLFLLISNGVQGGRNLG